MLILIGLLILLLMLVAQVSSPKF